MSRQKSTLTVKLSLAGAGADWQPPEWIMLIPAGRIEAVDGRVFINDAPEAIVAAFQRHGLELPIDINHKMELMPAGEEAPAMGWITALEVREGAIWARVEWTPRGARALKDREYRYISPAFWHDEQGRILELLSAALVTQPAFRMPALAARSSDPTHHKEPIMNRKALCRHLGLPEDADEEAVLAAIDELKKDVARQEQAGEVQIDPQKFVPRADYDRVQAELAAAQKALAERERRELEEAATRLVEEGIKAGKIAPASREFWLGIASQGRDGLKRVEAFLATAPQIVPGANAGTGEAGDAPTRKALTAAERQVAAALGLTEEEFIAARDEAGAADTDDKEAA